LALTRAAGGGRTFDHRSFGSAARELASQIDAATVSPAAVASALAKEYGAAGPVQTLSIACASGAAAILEGARAIRLGVCDVALCGGVGADVDPLMLAGFGKLSALSCRGESCPFDIRRDGFVVGEGAAMVVLSANPSGSVAEITGLGRTLDAYHLTQPDPQGDGAARAMQAALSDAQRSGVDYIQAHGTSTRLNDEVEARAIHRVFGEHTPQVYVSSIKGALGHWVAGAGAVGFLCALEAVRSGVLLPTANLHTPDPACALRHIMSRAVQVPITAALCNAFAFGGVNVSLVVEKGSA
jgi:3-oxoacyl-[acyl-carrier-protein] synthase II